jgi:hypothetical protein
MLMSGTLGDSMSRVVRVSVLLLAALVSVVRPARGNYRAVHMAGQRRDRRRSVQNGLLDDHHEGTGLLPNASC